MKKIVSSVMILAFIFCVMLLVSCTPTKLGGEDSSALSEQTISESKQTESTMPHEFQTTDDRKKPTETTKSEGTTKSEESTNDMITYYVKEVALSKKEQVFSKPVILCMDYIYYHLHESISGKDLSTALGINHSYLCTLFKKETGKSIGKYISDKRMEAAENMLKYSDYSLSQISEILNFSSYSHFARVFRASHNISPKEYRNMEFRHTDII